MRRNRAALGVLDSSGLRQTEVCGLALTAFHLAAGHVTRDQPDAMNSAMPSVALANVA